MAPLSRRELLLGTTATAALAVLAGCTLRPPAPTPTAAPSSTPSPSGPEPYVDALPDIALTRRFGSDDLGIESVIQTLVGTTLLVRDDSTTSNDTRQLIAVDAGTGARRWTMEDIDQRLDAEGSRFHPRTPLFVPASAAASVLATETYIDSCGLTPCAPGTTDVDEGLGVGALDVETGALRWHVRMTDDGYPQQASVVGCDDERFVVNVGDADFTGPQPVAPTLPELARIVAMGVDDGAIAWERPGLVATLVADVVLAVELVDDEQRVVALDRATGSTLWQAEPGESLWTRGRSMVVLQHLVDGTDRLVDLTTGDTILADVPLLAIGTDGAGGELAAWLVEERDAGAVATTLWTVDRSGEARPGATALDVELAFGVAGCAGGYVWIEETSGAVVAFDRSGARRSGTVAGTRITGDGDGGVIAETSSGGSRGFILYDVA